MIVLDHMSDECKSEQLFNILRRSPTRDLIPFGELSKYRCDFTDQVTIYGYNKSTSYYNTICYGKIKHCTIGSLFRSRLEI